MCKVERLGWVSIIFLALFFLVSLPLAMSADATIPVAATSVTGATEESPYKLTVKMGAMFLRRGDNHDNRIAGWADVGPEPPAGTHARVYSDDLDLGWAPGMDASIMLHNDCYGLEVRYMGLTEWSESASDAVVGGPPGNEDSDVAYASLKLKSKLNSVELNAHMWPCRNERYSLFTGFRWLRLTDRLMYSGGQGVIVEGFDGEFWHGNVSNRNTLYGGQIGIEGLLFGKRDHGFSLDGSVKTGWYANKISNEVSHWGYSTESGDDFWSDKSKSTRGVNMSELGINLNYAFTKNIAASIGYELLYISRISTIVVDNYSPGTQSVLYQGSRVGLNFMF